MRNQRITDTDAAALAGGTAPAGRPELADVATALLEFRVAAFESLPQPSAELRERLEHGSAPLAEEKERASAGGLRRMFATVTGLGLAAKIILGATVAVAAVGGAGVAGVLPQAAQTVFDTVVSIEESPSTEPIDEPIDEPIIEPSPVPSIDPSGDPTEAEGPAEGENFGSYVSDEAQNKEGTGREFGQQISDLAKENGNADSSDDDDSGTDDGADDADSTSDSGSGKPADGGSNGKKH